MCTSSEATKEKKECSLFFVWASALKIEIFSFLSFSFSGHRIIHYWYSLIRKRYLLLYTLTARHTHTTSNTIDICQQLPAKHSVFCVAKEEVQFDAKVVYKYYCYNHLVDHRQELNKQLDDIDINRDIFRQTLTHAEVSVKNLTEELRRIRQENHFNEMDLKQFDERLTQSTKEPDQPPNISI